MYNIGTGNNNAEYYNHAIIVTMIPIEPNE